MISCVTSSPFLCVFNLTALEKCPSDFSYTEGDLYCAICRCSPYGCKVHCEPFFINTASDLKESSEVSSQANPQQTLQSHRWVVFPFLCLVIIQKNGFQNHTDILVCSKMSTFYSQSQAAVNFELGYENSEQSWTKLDLVSSQPFLSGF